MASARNSIDKTFMFGGDVVTGDAGIDYIVGGAGGGTTLNGGAGFDYFSFKDSFNAAGSTINGGANSGEFLFSGNAATPSTFDMRAATITNIQELQISGSNGIGGGGAPNSVAVTIGSNQLGSGKIESNFRLGLFGPNTQLTIVDQAPTQASTIDLRGVGAYYLNPESGVVVTDASAATTSKQLYAPAFNSVLVGGSGSDFLQGGAGNDALAGGDGVDVLIGGDGVDTLFGNAGTDTLWGSYGADGAGDQLYGGDGSDTYFLYELTDTVTETNSSAAVGGVDLVYSSNPDHASDLSKTRLAVAQGAEIA